MQPETPRLYSLQGFQYCDLLLAEAERAASRKGVEVADGLVLLEAIRRIEERAAESIEWETTMLDAPILDFALHHLTLGRAELYRSILFGYELPARTEIEKAVDGLRRAGVHDYLLRGLLTRAWLLVLENNSPASSADLDEAKEIAERGPMPLLLADIALYRGRLFGDRTALAEARRLIVKHGYGRRLGELEDAEAAMGVAA